ncbi:unnamed protein product [Agarophyton chilense]
MVATFTPLPVFLLLACVRSGAVLVHSAQPIPPDLSHNCEQQITPSKTITQLLSVAVAVPVLCCIVAQFFRRLSHRYPAKLSLLYAQIFCLLLLYHTTLLLGLPIWIYGVASENLEVAFAGAGMVAAVFLATYSSWNTPTRLRHLWHYIPTPTCLSEPARKELPSAIASLLNMAMDDTSSPRVSFNTKCMLKFLLLKFGTLPHERQLASLGFTTNQFLLYPQSVFTMMNSIPSFRNAYGCDECVWMRTWAVPLLRRLRGRVSHATNPINEAIEEFQVYYVLWFAVFVLNSIKHGGGDQFRSFSYFMAQPVEATARSMTFGGANRVELFDRHHSGTL